MSTLFNDEKLWGEKFLKWGEMVANENERNYEINLYESNRKLCWCFDVHDKYTSVKYENRFLPQIMKDMRVIIY